jgi:RNA-directed DNA polymerase
MAHEVGIGGDDYVCIGSAVQHHGTFNRSAMYPLLQRINAYLIRWIRNKYKRLRAKTKAFRCWRGIVQRYPRMFAHWAWTASAPAVW